MCGRYASSKDAAQLVDEFEVAQGPPQELAPDYNVAPTKKVYAVVEREIDGSPAQRELAVVRWGLVPSWAKDPKIGNRMINARAETIADKPAYRRAFARRRALLPADGYYEWYRPKASADRTKQKPVKQPFFIHPEDGSTAAMAAVYEFWRDPNVDDGQPDAWWWTVSVITTQASQNLAQIHDRMPVHLSKQHWGQWLDPAERNPDRLSALISNAQVPMSAYPVATMVNSVRNNGAELLQPLPAAETEHAEPK